MSGRRPGRGPRALRSVGFLAAFGVLAPTAQAAVISSVQTGTAVSTAAGTLTVSIGAIDPTRSFLLFETRHDSNRPVGSMVGGRIASATTLEFVRVSNQIPAATVSIRWYVAEFSSGVRVQRGEVSQTAATLDVPIAAVAAVDQAFVTWSKTPQPIDQHNLNGDDPVLGELTSTTNLQFRVDTLRDAITIYWQVVEFTSATEIRVQKGTTSLTVGALSVDVNLAPVDAVDVSSTFLLVGYRNSGSGADIGARMLRAQLVDSTTIRIERDIAGNNDDIEEIVWQAVELRDGSEVIRGTASLATGVAQTVIGLGGRKVDTTGAVAFASVQPVGGQNTGMTPYAGDDVPGVCSVTMDLAPKAITVDRDNTADTCDVGWFVVQFAPTATTAVTLSSFTATGRDRAVELEWETGSEMNNLGFHLYRSLSATGPWERITAALIPGLGSSPEGALYGYHDPGLENGVTYHYQLEDVETTGRTEQHGPVSATPGPDAVPGPEPPPPTEETPLSPVPTEEASAWIRYGEPEATSLSVRERGPGQVVVELRTGGFHAWHDPAGGVRFAIPGFEESEEPGGPALPVRRAWIEVLAGRKVSLAAVVGRDEVPLDGLQPAVVGALEMWPAADGTVQTVVQPRPAGASFQAAGLYPETAARVRRVAFQGETKKAQLELSPLRWDRSAGRLVLARRLLLRVVFTGRDPGEVSRGGSRGRARWDPGPRSTKGVLVRLAVRDRGLQSVAFEDVFGARTRPVPVSALSLSRQGAAVAFHAEPSGRFFRPGSVLYFVSEGASLNPHGQEAVYELALAEGGLSMPIASGAPVGVPVPHYWVDRTWEVDRIYQPGLLQAEDPWFWDAVSSPVSKAYPLSVSALAETPALARLDVWLQGGSDFAAAPDHHVRVSVNNQAVAEASWDGKAPFHLEAALGPGILHEGENILQIQNVGDTAAAHSLVFLDRYALGHPRALVAEGGVLEGGFDLGGSAEVFGLEAGSFVIDTTEPSGLWLADTAMGSSGLRFRSDPGRTYLAVSPASLRRPEVRPARPSFLRSPGNRAEYLVVAPGAFLSAAGPLLEHRRGQGLETLAVAIEDVYDAFGFGEAHPEGLRDFLEHAFHVWEVGPRYVLLLGDASYDFKDHRGQGGTNPVPPYMIRDTYLWTASDPAYASVNGSDPLPDLALGRLPAASLEEARTLVRKVLDWEDSGFDLSGRAVLVADNPDPAGDFEADADHVARTLLAGRAVERIDVGRLGGATRPTIQAALDQGAALMSYLGHGGVAVWASENVWNNWDVPTLTPQAEQPFVLTMNCLNGYFHNPGLNSLAEELVKAADKGAIGAFAPSSLSVHWAARLYHEALVRELSSGGHDRLGDAVLAAQVAYTHAGGRVELLRTYQLLADPALRIR